MSFASAYTAAFRGLSREVWLLALVSFVNRSGTMVIPFLTLYLTAQGGFSATRAGGTLALYGLGALGGISLGGALADRIGCKPVQLTSLVLGGLFFFVLGEVGTGVLLAPTVVALGAINEAFRPANAAAVASFSAPAERARAFGLQRLAVNLGWTVGPAVGGFLAERDYHWLFRVDGATCLIAAAILACALPAAPRARPLAALRIARSPYADGLFRAAFCLLVLQGLVFFQLQSTLPLHLARCGHKATVFGSLMVVNTLSIVLLEMQVVRAVERMRPLRVVALASVLIGVGFGLTPLATSFPLLATTVLVWTAGEMLSAPLASAWVSRRSDETTRGAYMAAFGTSFSLASLAAPLFGTLAYERLGANALFGGCFGLGAIAALGFLILARRDPAGASRASS